jgi:CheY-like chemotaxis protein
MMISLEQIRAARAILGLKQHQLAKKAGISTGTLNNIERGVQTDPKMSTMRAIQEALEADGVEFLNDEDGTTGVRLHSRRSPLLSNTILVIDDSQIDRELYKVWLATMPKKYRVVEAGSAKEGYETFLKLNPACIILDFMMYGKDGFQLLVEMKREHAKIPPIIFVTATNNAKIKKDVTSLGVAAFLDKKNLTCEKLCEAVTKALA